MLDGRLLIVLLIILYVVLVFLGCLDVQMHTRRPNFLGAVPCTSG